MAEDEFDVLDLVDQLVAGRTAKRTQMDHYRDFRAVFLDSDAGRRVLTDILLWANFMRSSVIRADHHATSENEGMRRLALKIIATAHVEPKLVRK